MSHFAFQFSTSFSFLLVCCGCWRCWENKLQTLHLICFWMFSNWKFPANIHFAPFGYPVSVAWRCHCHQWHDIVISLTSFFFAFAPSTTQCICMRAESESIKRDDDERRSGALIIIAIIMNVCGKYSIERVHFGDTFFFCRPEIACTFPSLTLSNNVKNLQQPVVGTNAEAKYQFFNISILIYLAVTYSIHTWSPFSDTTNDDNNTHANRKWRNKKKKTIPKNFLKHSGALLTCPYPAPQSIDSIWLEWELTHANGKLKNSPCKIPNYTRNDITLFYHVIVNVLLLISIFFFFPALIPLLLRSCCCLLPTTENADNAAAGLLQLSNRNIVHTIHIRKCLWHIACEKWCSILLTLNDCDDDDNGTSTTGAAEKKKRKKKEEITNICKIERRTARRSCCPRVQSESHQIYGMKMVTHNRTIKNE